MIGTAVLALCAATGGWLDLAYRRLPNWLCLVTALAGLTFVWTGQGGVGAALAAGHMVVALLVGMCLFGVDWIGAGDAKFYAACAAWFPISMGLALLLWVSLAGLALVLLWLPYRQLARARGGDSAGSHGMIPYGVAIAVGAVAARALA